MQKGLALKEAHGIIAIMLGWIVDLERFAILVLVYSITDWQWDFSFGETVHRSCITFLPCDLGS